MQGHMVKAQTLAGWVDVHLADTLGLVAGIPEGLGQGLGEIPRHLVFVAHPSRIGLVQASQEGCAGRHTGGHRRISIDEIIALAGHHI